MKVHRRFGLSPTLGLKVSQITTQKKEIVGCLLGLLFDHEDGGDTFLRNISEFLPDYKASHHQDSIPHSRHCENFKRKLNVMINRKSIIKYSE
jgi:hypothetical protein